VTREATRTAVVALAGNPNSGKTSLFNALTGAFQKVGNYPGITVERVSATLRLGDREVELVDAPGLYTTKAATLDEQVAMQVLEGEPDLLVCVIDATSLERNLYFYSQISARSPKRVVALTMTDRLAAQGSTLDLEGLERRLGATVVPVVPHKGAGLTELKAAIGRALDGRAEAGDLSVEIALASAGQRLVQAFAQDGIDLSLEDARAALATAPEEMDARVTASPNLREALAAARRAAAAAAPGVEDRYAWASHVARETVRPGPGRRLRSASDRIDAVLTHRVFGLGVFVAVMYGVFQSIYTLAEPLMAGIEVLFGALGGWAGAALAHWPAAQSLVVDGMIAGAGSVVTFLPQIVILFLFISLLEGCGYLARAAFLMDRLLGWAGLNGRAFVPLLSSFACAIPGIMAARVMPDERSRLATILVAPLMSCSARLPVYVLMIGAFIEPRFGAAWAGFTLFAMHFLGVIVALPVVWALNRSVLRGRRLPLLLELPPYQRPKLRDVALTVYFRARVFVYTAGTIIVAMSVLIWALLYFPRSEAATARWQTEYAALPAEVRTEVTQEHFVQRRQIESSYLGQFGKAIEPAFEPLGFDWRLTTAILAAFPAREVVISSMGVLFALGGEVDEGSADLRTRLQGATWPDGRPLITTWSAIGLMAFFALCCQCGATLATIKRETGGWRWPVFVFAYMTALAYLAALLVQVVAASV
jgi:ferrous iron transport protein B